MATATEVLQAIAIMGFTYVKTYDTNYAFFKSSGTYTFGDTSDIWSTSEGPEMLSSTHLTLNNIKRRPSTMGSASYVFSALRYFRDCTGIDMMIPTSGFLVAIAPTSGVNYWTCSETSTSAAYVVNGTTKTSTAKTTYCYMGVVVDLNHAYIARYGKPKIGSFTITNSSRNLSID